MRAIGTRELLLAGVEHPDQTGISVRYRFIREDDSIDEITEMLHDAYRPLAEKGMRFVASYQDIDETRQRTQKGDTIVAIGNNQIVGIVTLSDVAATRGCAFYDRDDVASFGQFAVRPSHQSRGIGSKLLHLVETLAHEKGVGELALDTSEHATDLIAMYQAKGFRFIEYAQWKRTNYRSIVFSKTLRVPRSDSCEES